MFAVKRSFYVPCVEVRPIPEIVSHRLPNCERELCAITAICLKDHCVESYRCVELFADLKARTRAEGIIVQPPCWSVFLVSLCSCGAACVC